MNPQISPHPVLRSRPGGRQPLLWAALAYTAGLSTGVHAWRPPLWWLVAWIVFAASAAYLLRRRVRAAFTLGLCALFITGALTIQVRAPRDPGSLGLLEFTDGQEVLVTAHVSAEGPLRAEGSGDVRQRLDVETEQVTTGNHTFEVHSGLRVSFYGKRGKNESEEESSTVSARLFRYGQRLLFPVKLYPPRNFRNPGAFDYQGYLAENGIAALGSTKATNVELLPGFTGSRAELWRTRLHRSIVKRIHSLWPADEAALVDAMLLGEESFMGPETLTEFQRTGTYHVLVVSGLKVGILSLVTFWLLRRLRVGDLAASVVAVLLTVVYAVLTDVGAPVWRATLMLALYLGARLLYRQRAVLNTIGGAALALLILDPAAPFGASFQLSFMCVLIIAAVGLPLVERTTQPHSRALRHLDAVSYDVALPPRLAQFRLDLRMIAGRLARFFGKRMPLMVLGGIGRLLLISCEFLVISAVHRGIARKHPGCTADRDHIGCRHIGRGAWLSVDCAGEGSSPHCCCGD